MHCVLLFFNISALTCFIITVLCAHEARIEVKTFYSVGVCKILNKNSNPFDCFNDTNLFCILYLFVAFIKHLQYKMDVHVILMTRME